MLLCLKFGVTKMFLKATSEAFDSGPRVTSRGINVTELFSVEMPIKDGNL
jgi:hypothetical protein